MRERLEGLDVSVGGLKPGQWDSLHISDSMEISNPCQCLFTRRSRGLGWRVKPGFYTEVRDGRSKELEDLKKHGEPAHQVTRVGGGPNGMTIRSSDAKIIDDYLAAK